MVGQGAKGFVAQRDLVAEAPGQRPVKGLHRRERHVLVDPAESVYRHFFDE